MKSKLPWMINAFGFLEGLKLYRHIKSKNSSGIALPGLKQPVHFRGIVSDTEIFRQIFIEKQYDIDVNFEPASIVDLGANVGYASVYFANRFPAARIFALEPESMNYTIAIKNLASYKNVRLEKGAVWHTAGNINLVDKGHGEAAYMVETGEGNDMVRAYTIPEIMSIMQFNQIDIIKIDIEGAEKEIFENGSDQWIPQSRIIIVETHDRYKRGTSKAVFQAISKYDFSLELKGENLIFYNNQF